MKEFLGACITGDILLVEKLIKTMPLDQQDDEGNTALMYASKNGYEDIVSLILQHGASVNIQNKCGYTALIKASPHKSIALLLIDNGANVDHQCMDGDSVLMWALHTHNKETAEILINNMADCDIRNNKGESPLIIATNKGYKEIVIKLLENGATLDFQDKGGFSALINAAFWGHTEIVSLLKESDIDLQTCHSNTALMFSAEHGDAEIVKILLENNAKLDIKDDMGCTALHLACIKNNEDIIFIFHKYGADFTLKNNKGESSLDLLNTSPKLNSLKEKIMLEISVECDSEIMIVL